MQSEIFRFAVIRNSRKLSKAQKELLSIQIDFDPDHRSQPHKVMKLIHSNLDDINSISEDSFYNDVKPLLFNNEMEFVESNSKNEKVLNLALELQKTASVEQFLSKGLPSMLKTTLTKTDKSKIEDSIVYGIFRRYNHHEWNELSREVLRANHIAEQIKSDKTIFEDPTKLYKLINSIIILPKAIFPLPNKNEQRAKENREKAKEHRDNISRIIKDKNDELEALNVAIEEVSNQHSKFMRDVKDDDTIEYKSLTRLPRTYINKLSDKTKKIIRENLNFDDSEELDHVDVADTTGGIEKILLNNNKVSLPTIYDRDINDKGGIKNVTKTRPGPCGTIVVAEEKVGNNFENTRGKVEFVGILDLKKVKQELYDYRPGEIAHVENVLKGESKSKKHRKLSRVEETIFEETERTEETEKSLETTDRYELQREANQTISESTSKEAGVNITADYGRVNMEANASVQSDKKVDQSNKSASTFSKEVIAKSVQKVKERILKRRSRTTVNEIEITNKHELNNIEGTGHISGKYFWMNKYYKAQLVNYGERAILSFMVPEPAAFYKYARESNVVNENLKPPEIPSMCMYGRSEKLRPIDIERSNYLYWVGKYSVTDVSPPPPEYRVVSGNASLSFNNPTKKPDGISKEVPVAIPEGYNAQSMKFTLTAGRGHRKAEENNSANVSIKVTCGNHRILSIDQSDHGSIGPNGIPIAPQPPHAFEDDLTFDSKINKELVLNNEEDSVIIAISIASDISVTVILNAVITVHRSANRYTQWQIETFNSIMTAYQGLKLEYDENIAQQDFNMEVNIQGQNPLINRKTEETELKRQVISIMSGQHFEGFNAMEEDQSKEGVHRYPQLNLEESAEEGGFVRLYEQSFEWHNMIYNFYPYFWGRKENWVKQQHIKDVDFQFEQFLKAGYAKVEVPIRPGFEKEVFEKIQIPQIGLDGTDIKVLSEDQESDNYLAVIDEILEGFGHDYGDQPEGTISIEHDSKIAVGNGTKLKKDDIDREIIIDLKSYRIRYIDVNDPQKITLDRKYKSDKTDPDEQNLENEGFWLGAKFVGEPWLVEVPTSLVILK